MGIREQEAAATRSGQIIGAYQLLLDQDLRSFFIESFRRAWPELSDEAWWELLLLEAPAGGHSRLLSRGLRDVQSARERGEDPLSLLDFSACCKLLIFYDLAGEGAEARFADLGTPDQGCGAFFRVLGLPGSQRGGYLRSLRELQGTRNEKAHLTGQSRPLTEGDFQRVLAACRAVMNPILDAFPEEEGTDRRLWELGKGWQEDARRAEEKIGYPPFLMEELLERLALRGIPREEAERVLSSLNLERRGELVLGWSLRKLEELAAGLARPGAAPAAPAEPEAPEDPASFAGAPELEACRARGGILTGEALEWLAGHATLVAGEGLFLSRSGRDWLEGSLCPLLARKGKRLLLDSAAAGALLSAAREEDPAGERQRREARTGVKLLARLSQAGLAAVCGSRWPDRSPQYNLLHLIGEAPGTLFCVLTGDRGLLRRLAAPGFENAAAVTVKADGTPVLNLATLSAPGENTPAEKAPAGTKPEAPAQGEKAPALRVPLGKGEEVRVRRTGEPILLERSPGEELGTGGEGVILRTRDPALAAKLYHPQCRTREREEKLALMLESDPGIPNLAWPRDILEDREGRFLGFLMERKEGVEMAASVMRSSRMAAPDSPLPGWTRLSLAELCAAIAGVFDQLHRAKILMGDVNPRNFLIRDSRTPYFLDCDSYQIGPYRCPVGTPIFTDPEIYRAYGEAPDYSSFPRTEENESYALASLLFQIVMLGKAPFASSGGANLTEAIRTYQFAFPFGEELRGQDALIGPYRKLWSHLPYRLKEAFYKVFTGGERATPLEWRQLFLFYAARIRDGRSTDELLPRTYKEVQGDGVSRFVTVTCQDCGRSFPMDEDTYRRRQERGSRIRCDSCAGSDRIEHEVRVSFPCAGCGQKKPIPRARITEMQEKGRPVYCDDCLSQRRRKVPVACASCGKQFQAPQGMAGPGRRLLCPECLEKSRRQLTLRCPRCGRAFQVSALRAEEAQRKDYTLECPDCHRELEERVETLCGRCRRVVPISRRTIERAAAMGREPFCDDCRKALRQKQRS